MEWLVDANKRLAKMQRDAKTRPQDFIKLYKETNKRLAALRSTANLSIPRQLRQAELSFLGYHQTGSFLVMESADKEKLTSICYGDSGGASFVIKDKKPVLVGVTARLGQGLTCASQSLSTDVKAYTEWVNGGPKDDLDSFYEVVNARLGRIDKSGIEVTRI